MNDEQLGGVVLIVLGLLLVLNCRRLARAANTINRLAASAYQQLSPKRTRGIVSVWARSGTDDSPGWRFLRAYVAACVGIGMIAGGVALLVGTWS